MKILLVLATTFALGVPALSVTTQPTVEQFKQVLKAHLQKLKPDGTSVRTVLFQKVMPGKPNDATTPSRRRPLSTTMVRAIRESLS